MASVQRMGSNLTTVHIGEKLSSVFQGDWCGYMVGIGGACWYYLANSINLGDLTSQYRAEYNWVEGQLQADMLHREERQRSHYATIS